MEPKASAIIPNFACLPLAGEAKFARRAAAKNPEGVLSCLAGYPGFFQCTFSYNGKIWDTSLSRPDSRRIWSIDPSHAPLWRGRLGADFSRRRSRQKKSGIILAGGRNTRMHGRDKAFLEIGGRPLIAGIIDNVRPLVNEVIVVTNTPEKYKGFDVKLVRDDILNKGPLMGVYAGLKKSSSKYNIVIACDMPFINTELIEYMHKNAPGYDVVVPKINNRYEPLFSIYSKNCLKYIKGQIDKKDFKIRNFFSKVKVRTITKREILQFGLPEKMFMNVNTPEGLHKIKKA